MNREAIHHALSNIKNTIAAELESRQDDKLKNNYVHGIKICDDMLARVSDNNLAFTAKTLLGTFDRYTIDSLPWTGDILKVIDAQRKIIERECKSR